MSPTQKIGGGAKDYWAPPGQFFSKFGDCEDYAIAKFLTLRALGFTGDELRVVVVRDLNLKIGHAILAAYIDGKIYILDNQIKQAIAATTIRHYRRIYSVNEDGWCPHKDSNFGPLPYQGSALPLSYVGAPVPGARRRNMPCDLARDQAYAKISVDAARKHAMLASCPTRQTTIIRLTKSPPNTTASKRRGQSERIVSPNNSEPI